MKPDSSDEQAFARYRGRWIERALADRGLSDGAFRTLAGIAHHFLNRKERKLWAAQDTIAAKLGISRRSVQEHLKELRERGLIRSQRQGRDKPNHYFPVVDDAQNSAYHDGDEAQIFAHQKSVMKRRSASDDAQNCVIKTREDLRTNTWKELIEEPIEGGAGLQPAPASSSNVSSSETISSDRSPDQRGATSFAPNGASVAQIASDGCIFSDTSDPQSFMRNEDKSGQIQTTSATALRRLVEYIASRAIRLGLDPNEADDFRFRLEERFDRGKMTRTSTEKFTRDRIARSGGRNAQKI